MPTTAALEGLAADLRSRIAALEERYAKIPVTNETARRAQQFNVADLSDELADVERQIQARHALGRSDVAWYLPSRKFRIDLGPEVGALTPWVGTRRKGQAVRRLRGAGGKVRARVADNYEIVVDGAPVSSRLLTRREAAHQAHVGAAGAPYGGRLPTALTLSGRALARFLHENRDGRTNRKKRKTEKRRRAKIRALMSIAEVQDALRAGVW